MRGANCRIHEERSPERSPLVPCGVFENSRKHFNKIFKNSDLQKFRPTKFRRYTVIVTEMDSATMSKYMT